MPTAVVLSGGANLGAVQVGMLRALIEREVQPDLIVGTSVGAINGAYIADRWNIEGATGLGEIWMGLRRSQVFPTRPIGGFFGFVGRRDHLVPADGLRRIVRRHVGNRRLEEFAIPLHVVATDVRSGVDRCLSAGHALDAIVASASIPGVFPAVRIDGSSYIDGGVVNNAPLSHAISQGATTVWVLPAGYACGLDHAPSSALAMALHAVSLLINRRLQLDIERFEGSCDVHVLPPLCPVAVGPTDFGQARQLMERSYASSVEWLAGTHAEAPSAVLDHTHG
jgi:NTE family protein